MLQDRVVMITGAAGNLGPAVAQAAYEAGAMLVLLDRSEARLQQTSLPSGDRVMAIGGLDLGSPEVVSRVAREAMERFGRLDGLVCTVGAFRMGDKAYDESLDDWRGMFDANLRTTIAACQAVAPLLRDRTGRIVTVGARASLKGIGGMAAYSAAKAAVVRFTESLADDLAERGITANCVLPSIIDTPANREAMPKADHSRWVQPSAIADVIVFLLSDRARAVSGAAIPVFGRS